MDLSINTQNELSGLIDEINSSCPNYVVDALWLISDHLITEGQNLPLKGTKYFYRIDPPRGIPGPGNQYHFHLILKGNDVLAINIDGTSHDNWHNVRIPDEVIPFLTKKGYKIPANQIIESQDDYDYVVTEIAKSYISELLSSEEFLKKFYKTLSDANKVQHVYKVEKGSLYFIQCNEVLYCYKVLDCNYEEDKCTYLRVRFALSDFDNVISDPDSFILFSKRIPLNDFILFALGFELTDDQLQGIANGVIMAKSYLTSTQCPMVYISKVSNDEYRIVYYSTTDYKYKISVAKIFTLDQLYEQIEHIYKFKPGLNVDNISHIINVNHRLVHYINECKRLIDSNGSASPSSLAQAIRNIEVWGGLGDDDVCSIIKYCYHLYNWRLVNTGTEIIVSKS